MVGNFVWASGSGQEEVRGSHKKLGGGERGAKGQVKLLRPCGSMEFGHAASGFVTQGIWLGNRKVGSQVIKED